MQIYWIIESKTYKQTKVSQVVVIGTSAGGMHELKKLVAQINKPFPLPILVVQHISPDSTGNVLLDALNKSRNLHCQHAKNGSSLLPGYLYLAPSDHHLMIDSEL